MAVKPKKRINPIWYILPVVEIVGFFIPYAWVGGTGSMVLSIIVFVSSIASIVGFFLIRKQSIAIALINFIIGVIVLILFMLFVIIGTITGTPTT